MALYVSHCNTTLNCTVLYPHLTKADAFLYFILRSVLKYALEKVNRNGGTEVEVVVAFPAVS